MNRLSLLAAVLALACAGPKAPVPRSSAQSTAVPAGTRWELPLQGVSAEFPAKPDQFESRKELENGAMTTSTLAASHAEHVFTLSYTTRGGQDRPRDADWVQGMRKTLAKAESLREIERGDFRGLEVREVEDGKRTATWFLLVGDGFVSAVVSGAEKTFDERAAQRFFASVRFELPWRLYAAPIGRLSIAVPATAVEVSAAQLSYAAEGPSRAFFVGGKHDLAFVIGTVELDAELEAQPQDELLARSLHALVAQGMTLSWQAPIEFDGARGLDFLGELSGVQVRGRLLRVNHYLYSLQVRSSSRAAATGEHAKRFLESLRWY